MEKIVSFCKRKGFIFQSSSIYGGIGGFYDYGPLGSQMKKNIKDNWWNFMVNTRANVVGLDSAIIVNPKVWEASGHLENFTDPLTECRKCHKRFRADHLIEGCGLELSQIKCPECNGDLMDVRNFNLMLKTFIGPVEDSSSIAYLRPETAQAIFINFKNVLDTQRLKIPFGIAQIGKAFRNEITPGNFVFRTREFEQMEMEFFIKPGEQEKWFKYWLDERIRWYTDILGIKKENLRIKETPKEDLAHYAIACADIEYNFPSMGWSEIEGVASRGDYDLSQHEKYSGEDLKYFDEAKGEKYIPYVIEPSCGVDRTMLALICDAYEELEKGRSGDSNATEIVLKLNSNISPIKIAVLPLVKNKEEITSKAKQVFNLLSPCFVSEYDETGTIGKRYRRQDEIGTPFCVTIDFDTLNDNAVTVRNRDTMGQERILIKDLMEYFNKNV
ncbi:MAG: glycine--tRNA ligase [Candidatus Pacebacteria bacterium]|nr:glycine--tRNA ligase [Candidatus Paceibacterota bacterium]